MINQFQVNPPIRNARSTKYRVFSSIALLLIIWILTEPFGQLSLIQTVHAQDKAVKEVRATIGRAAKMLHQANQFMQDGDHQKAFNTARDAARILKGITSLAELTMRQYMLGQTYTLLGLLLANSGQHNEAMNVWATAMASFDIFYKGDADFWRQASRPESNYEHAGSNLATLLDYQAQISEQLGQFQKALEYLQYKASFLNKLGKVDESHRAFQQKLSLIDRHPTIPHATRLSAQVMSDIAVLMANNSRPNKALRLVNQALDTITKAAVEKDPAAPAVHAEILTISGYVLQGNGRHADAVRKLSDASARFSMLDNQEGGHLKALDRLFVSLYVLERFPEAENVLRQQATLAKNAENPDREYTAHSNLMLVYKELGNYSAVKNEFAALALITQGNAIPLKDRVRVNANMGVIHSANGFHAEAFERFSTAIKLLEEHPGTELQRAEYHIDLALALSRLQKPGEALAAIKAGLATIKGISGNELIAARLQRQLSAVNNKGSGSRQADLNACKNIIAAQNNDPETMRQAVSCLVDIGRNQLQSGKTTDAVASFTDALNRLGPAQPVSMLSGTMSENPTGKKYRWAVLTGLGFSLLMDGQNREATKHLVAASNIDRDIYLNSLMTLGTIERYRRIESRQSQIVAGQVAVSLAFARKDTNIALAYEEAVSNKNLFSEVSRLQREALQQVSGNQAKVQKYIELRSHIARHVLDWQRGDGDKGVESEIVESLFKQMKRLEGSILQPLYNSTGLVSQLSGLSGRISNTLGKDEALLEFVRYLPLDIAAVQQLEVKSLAPADDANWRYGVFVISGATGRITAIDLGAQQHIDDILLAFRYVQQRQTDPRTFNLDEKELAKAIEPMRRLIFDPLINDLGRIRRIYVAAEGQISLVPFEAIPIQISDSKPRYLVEDCQVVYLTTGRDLIRFSNKTNPSTSSEAWLIGDPNYQSEPGEVVRALGRTTRTVPTTTFVPAPKTVIADVGFMSSPGGDDLGNWPRLENTLGPIKNIANIASKAGLTPQILTGAAASESNLRKMHAPRLAVFATHGKFLESAPQIRFTITSLNISSTGSSMKGFSEEEMLSADPLFRSMLALAGAGADHSEPATDDGYFDDGLLTAYEAWGLDLHGTELVALIACETGLGVVQTGNTSSKGLRQPSGEVVSGLRQAFSIAGANSIIMSMWSVPLNETMGLLTHFLNAWLKDKQDRYASFHQAQLAALHQARDHRASGHPFWWAGFVYFGDPGALNKNKAIQNPR